jgi:N-acetyl-gamma-glutamyl-phosphate reductase
MATPVHVAIYGASGYSGAELLRLLSGHPAVRVVAAGANEHAGERVGDLFPHLAPFDDMVLGSSEPELARGCDAALLALPHGVSSVLAPALLEEGVRVVDLAGDFRLPAECYPEWYGFDHPAPQWLGKAVYGLPELFASEIVGAELVANPGCYPTAVALSCAPLLRSGLVAGGVLTVDAKSGVSGAGARPTSTVHYAHTEGSVRPYGVGRHQHTPEIELVLERAAGLPVRTVFVPHLVPAVRGVLVTCYLPLAEGATMEALGDALLEAYRAAPFVRVLPPGAMPDPKRVTGANVCEVGVGVDLRAGVAVAVGALDNLVKGAAGQAVQNLNLMFGLDQTLALPEVGLYP